MNPRSAVMPCSGGTLRAEVLLSKDDALWLNADESARRRRDYRPGIFILTGVAAHDRTGPALMLSFALAGLACVFAALCYAEFASMVPVAGSAYTYAYATLGELFAWIIGWDLILECAVGAATVAHGWSAHFQEFIPIFHEGISQIPAKIPAEFHTAPFNYCLSVGEGCTHTGFVMTGF